MRIQILSDLHVEFHRDLGTQFITQTLRPDTVEVLIIAGDLGNGPGLNISLPLISRVYSKATVIYVPGNHEYYASSFDEVHQEFASLEEHLPNVLILNNKAVELDGLLFIGTPLWFPETNGYEQYARYLNDFRLIRNFVPRVFAEHAEAVRFLDWHLCRDAVVVTHFSPTPQSTPKQYLNDPLNIFFHCNLEHLITERRPRLWVHGHTHTSFNYMLGDTHIVCNPLGYIGRETNFEFLPHMMIDT
jgi:predicted phosphodiesterase